MVNRSLVPPGEDQIPERAKRGQGDKPVPRGREMGAAEPAGFSSLGCIFTKVQLGNKPQCYVSEKHCRSA